MTNRQPMQLHQAIPVRADKRPPLGRDQTTLEEIFNALSHGLGLLLAIASLPILVYSAAQKGQAASIVGASLFAGTAIVLYLISTLYHALPMGRAKAWFNRLDHAAIYLFIAGSYMPFLFGVLRGPWGWTGGPIRHLPACCATMHTSAGRPDGRSAMSCGAAWGLMRAAICWATWGVCWRRVRIPSARRPRWRWPVRPIPPRREC